ncbi:MAG: hypothetical protein BEN19_02600 [Epulopiscium sp. Nuni2H_MBin003]|nr:MAG: hypothetical protein BEN19_02600 [Epulopiscium sp. Nuni2H_MBin003]
MGIAEIFMLSIGLSADAFAVSVCKGLQMKKLNLKYAVIIALYFGIFQAIMPLTGFVLGEQFGRLVDNIDHWIAFLVLGYIGLNLVKTSRGNEDEDIENTTIDISVKVMLALAVATSIDALAVGITFSFLQVNIIPTIIIIGLITFLCCVVGVKIGNVFGLKYKSKAECVGGIILILIGSNILLQHFL